MKDLKTEIENLGPESSYYELEEHLTFGTYYFFIYQINNLLAI